jgi:hypothetical protein
MRSVGADQFLGELLAACDAAALDLGARLEELDGVERVLAVWL